ncbi:MAG: TonB-dependent receptor [Steroidobacteraceae bacterium]
MSFNAFLLRAVCGTAPLFLGANLCCAQSTPAASPDSLQEITVTATKFGATDLRTTPITIEAFTGEQLEARQVTGPEALMSQVSGFVVDKGSSTPRIFIRGIGQDLFLIGTEGGVAVYQDGVYISRVNAILMPFNDIADVEVLKGPQGAGFGRNATGGAVLNTSMLPMPGGLSGQVSAGGGSYSDRNVSSYVTGGSQELSGRFAAYGNYDDGYVKNEYLDTEQNATHQLGARGTALYNPSWNSDLQVILRAQFDDQHTTFSSQNTISIPGIGALFGGQYVLYNSHSWITDSNIYPFTNTQVGIYSATVNYDLGFAQLKSISGVVAMIWNNVGDYDDTTAPFLQSYGAPINDTELTQEFDLTGQIGRLRWAAGLYYLHEKTHQDETIDYGSEILPPGEGTFILDHHWQRLESGAAFSSLQYSLTDHFRVIGGVRFTRDVKDFLYDDYYNLGATGGVPNGLTVPYCVGSYSAGFNSWTGDFGFDFDLSNNSFAYVRWSRGFKAGGFSDNTCGNDYQPETVNSYEVGLKNSFFDKRVTLNVSAFLYDYNNMQVSVIVPTGGPGSPTLSGVENAGTSHIQGLDLDGAANITRNWTLNAAFSWLPVAKYTEFNSLDPYVTNYANFGIPLPAVIAPRYANVSDCAPINGFPNCVYDLTGNRLNRSPKISAILGSDYTVPLASSLTFTGRAEVSYLSSQYYSIFNSLNSEEPQHGIVNVFATLAKQPDGWAVKVFSTNLLNRFYYTGRLDNATILTNTGEFGRPREFGIKVSKQF